MSFPDNSFFFPFEMSPPTTLKPPSSEAPEKNGVPISKVAARQLHEAASPVSKISDTSGTEHFSQFFRPSTKAKTLYPSQPALSSLVFKKEPVPEVIAPKQSLLTKVLNEDQKPSSESSSSEDTSSDYYSESDDEPVDVEKVKPPTGLGFQRTITVRSGLNFLG